jgi:uncharacterized protein (DUF58 family)
VVNEPVGQAEGQPSAIGKRIIRLRPVAWFVVLFEIVAVLGLNAALSRYPAIVFVAVVFSVVFVVDGTLAFRAIAAPRLQISPVRSGDVGDEIELLISVRHTGRPLLLAIAGYYASDRFLVPAPGTGIFQLVLATPGRYTHQDVDVLAMGPFGLVSSTRRLRIELAAPIAVGPPSFAHMYPPAPVRPVFVGPSPGSPKGTELTRGVRPYLPGDHRRAVHWNMTAHTGSLMVREREGSGAIRVRVVLAILRPGPAAVVAAGRANAFIREFVGQGCEVELLTLQDNGRIVAALNKPYMPPSREDGLPPYRTVEGMIVDDRQIRERLCVAVPGLPEFRSAKIPTRIISDVGDQWA